MRVATADDRDAVVDTVVAAFERDPALRYFFPDDDRYGQQATAFVGHLFDRRVVHGTVWVHGAADAAALWSPPSSRSITPETVVGDAEMLEAVGAAGATRIQRYDETMAELLPDAADHWYLGILATRPEHVGRGLGRSLLRAGVEQVGGRIAHLETTNPANVGFYRSAGWSVIRRSDDTAPLPIWVLSHHGAR